MNQKIAQIGLAALALSLTACGDGSSETNPADPPSFSLHGGTIVTQNNNPVLTIENNNAKNENVIRNFDNVVIPGESIPLPTRGAFKVNQNYVAPNGKSYEIFIASDQAKYDYSRFSYIAEKNTSKRLYTYMGDATKEMPKMGQATYDGEAIHTFTRRNHLNQLNHNVVRAHAHGRVNFDAERPILHMTISPLGNHSSQYAFQEFNFSAQISGHSFNGKNVVGTSSASQEGLKIDTQGQFNGPRADEISGAYYIHPDRREYPNGAAGVFGLHKKTHDGEENPFK